MAVVWLKSGDGKKPLVESLAKLRVDSREAVAAKAGELSNKLLDE
jgi:hypothetical protein